MQLKIDCTLERKLHESPLRYIPTQNTTWMDEFFYFY